MEAAKYHGGFAKSVIPAPDGFVSEVKTAHETSRRTSNANSSRLLFEEGYDQRIEEIKRETGIALRHPLTDRYDEVNTVLRGFSGGGGNAGFRNEDLAEREAKQKQLFEAEIDRLREKHPNAGALYSEDEFINRVRSRAQALERRRSDVGLVAGFIGDVSASFTDPATIVTAPIGGSAKSILGAVVKNAAASGGVETFLQPDIQQSRKELGLSHGFEEGLKNVIAATAAGGVLGGGVKAGERAVGAASNTIPRKVQEYLGRHSDKPELRAGSAEIARDLDIEETAGEALGRAPDPVEAADAKVLMNEVERAFDGDEDAAAAFLNRQIEIDETGNPVIREIDDQPPVQILPDTSTPRLTDTVEPDPVAPARQAVAQDSIPRPRVTKADNEPGQSKLAKAVNDGPSPITIREDATFADGSPLSPAARQQVQQLADDLSVRSVADDDFVIYDVDDRGFEVERTISQNDLIASIEADKKIMKRLEACVR